MAQPRSQSAGQLSDAVTTAIDALTALEQRMRLGHPSQRAFDQHEADAARICADLRTAARGVADRSDYSPIARTQHGGWW